MKTNRLLGFAALLALIIALASAGVVVAQAKRTHGQGFGFGPGHMLAYAAGQLNLTSDQLQQIRTIVKSHSADIKALLDQGGAARKSLRQAIASANNDQISAAVTQLSAVELKGAQLASQIRASVYNDVLQPDQRTKADQLIQLWEQKADARRAKIEAFLDQL